MTELTLMDIDRFYDRYGSVVLYRCRRLLRHEEGAWDAMHQTFVRAIRYRSGFRGQSSPLSWLYSIANRVCLDEIRARGRRPALLDGNIELETGGLESFAERFQRQEMIAQLLSNFSEKVQEIVVLRYFDELEVQQISERTGLSERTVARRLSEFLRRSRRLLEAA